MFCPTCKRDVDVSNGYCRQCGGALGARLCPNGHVMDPSWTTCRYCSPQAAQGQKGRTVVENLGSGAPPAGGFLKGATLLEGGGAVPASGSATYVEQTSRKGQTVVEPGAPSGHAAKHRTVFDPGVAPSGAQAPARVLPRLTGWLVTFSHNPSGDDYRLREGRNVIGADKGECDVVVTGDVGMSAKHAVVMYRDGKFMIRDNDSVNGTYVNGTDIFGKESVELKPGDRIRLGGTEFILHGLLS